MSEQQEPVKWYEETSTYVWIAATLIVGWSVVVILLGHTEASTGGGSAGWSSGLYGDSFGFINAILTAAAFIAVVATFKKEQRQLNVALTQLEIARSQLEIERDRRSKESHESVLLDLFKSALAQYEQFRLEFLEAFMKAHDKVQWTDEDFSKALEIKLLTSKPLLPLDAVCELLLEQRTDVSEFFFRTLGYSLSSRLRRIDKDCIAKICLNDEQSQFCVHIHATMMFMQNERAKATDWVSRSHAKAERIIRAQERNGG